MSEKLCEKCNQPKKMYYELFCPRCQKPGIETREFYNLFRCMYHIEAIGNPRYKERLWDKISMDIQGNDSFYEIYREWDPEDEDIKLLFDTFDIKEDSMTFYISW